MKNLLIIVILLVVIGLSIRYVYRAKKNGKKCIGCPAGGNCSSCECAKTEE